MSGAGQSVEEPPHANASSASAGGNGAGDAAGRVNADLAEAAAMAQSEVCTLAHTLLVVGSFLLGTGRESVWQPSCCLPLPDRGMGILVWARLVLSRACLLNVGPSSREGVGSRGRYAGNCARSWNE